MDLTARENKVKLLLKKLDVKKEKANPESKKIEKSKRPRQKSSLDNGTHRHQIIPPLHHFSTA
jgi:hypothetical protein